MSSEQWSTVARHQRELMGETTSMNLGEFAAAAETSVEQALWYWRASGNSRPHPDSRVFTETDAQALAAVAKVIQERAVDENTALSLLRAQSYYMDRLVLWQVEAIVDDVVRSMDLDDVTARLLVLDRIGAFSELFESQLVYAWRRQMLNLLTRYDAEVAQRGVEPISPEAYPLFRVLGFVDMESYTARSANLGAAGLARMMADFEMTAYRIVTQSGARVVKNIGDSVLFIADTPEAGVMTVTALLAELAAVEGQLPLRGSLVAGQVMSRFGDVFGPPVNLASRLTAVAPVGEILIDTATKAILEESAIAPELCITSYQEENLRGFGPTPTFTLARRP